MKRILTALLVALLALSASAADPPAGVWVGMTSEYPSLFRMELAPDGTGRLAHVSRVSGEPEVRLYDVRWSLSDNGRKLDLELTPDAAGTPTPRIKARLGRDEIEIEIVRGGNLGALVGYLYPEARFRDDWDLAVETLRAP